jgi:hypothetical protein
MMIVRDWGWGANGELQYTGYRFSLSKDENLQNIFWYIHTHTSSYTYVLTGGINLEILSNNFAKITENLCIFTEHYV